MKVSEIRQSYLSFFVSKGHRSIESAPLVPTNDPTTLFTSSGMQQLLPFLKGEPHPMGKRLVDSQPSFRSQDIDEVGDNRHTTFFEMLGNWSLGDYFKADQLHWIFTFLTEIIGLDPRRIYVSVFEGNSLIPKDTESIAIWQNIFSSAGINHGVGERIFTYSAKKNWWSRSGEPENMPSGEIGGPDSEIFYDFGAGLHLHEGSIYKDSPCHPNCDCGRFFEIGNSVFMQFEKQADGGLRELPNKNVDFGGGLERIAAASENLPDIFQTDVFVPIINKIVEITGKKYQAENHHPMRVIADHLKAATFMISEGVEPSNKRQGYLLRRLLRRSAVKLRRLGSNIDLLCLSKLVDPIVEIYQDVYLDKQLAESYKLIINDEISKFSTVLAKGLREIEKNPVATPELAFHLFQSYGFPFEILQELMTPRLDETKFESLRRGHAEKSRTSSAGMFKGGLENHSEVTTKYHTVTHLLQQALRSLLGTHVTQAGSNISEMRLRFDFTHPEALSDENVKNLETIINQKIASDLPVTYAVMTYDQAKSSGALAFFKDKYPEKVTVYSIGDYSREICGGPHVNHTGQIGNIKVTRQESVGAGVRRIYLQITA